MKSIYSLLFAFMVFVGLCATTIIVDGCQQTVATNTDNRKESSIYLDKTKQVTDLRKEVAEIENRQFGVCDTCVTGFRSVIIQNRMLANELAKQNVRMKKTLDSNEAEIRKLESLHTRNKKYRQDYELRYALANN